MRRLLPAVALVLAGAIPEADAARLQRNPEVAIFGACPEVEPVVRDSGRMAAMLNPVFTTAAEVEAGIPPRRRLYDCLESLRFEVVQPDWFPPLVRSLGLFLAFADPPASTDPATLERVELGGLDDPAVRRLRTELGLGPPPGYVFIRYFPDLEAMPPIVRSAFEDGGVRAVTFGPRYVAILTESGLPPGPASRRALASTFSHEMVHAFLSAGLDWSPGARRLPGWFHEGMAVHFSGSGRAHVGQGPGGGFFRVGPTGEYEGYQRTFLYLEDALGAARFRSTLRRAVEEADVGLVLEAAGVEDEQTLAREADLWWRWRPLPPRWLAGEKVWLVAGAALALMGALVVLWRRWQPAVAESSLEVALNRDLMSAVVRGEAPEVRALLRSGADPNARGVDGTALTRAVEVGARECVEILIDSGARVDADVRRATSFRDDPEIERVVADAASRQREVW